MLAAGITYITMAKDSSLHVKAENADQLSSTGSRDACCRMHVTGTWHQSSICHTCEVSAQDQAGESSCCMHVARRWQQSVAPVGHHDEGQAHPERGDEPRHGVHQLHIGVDGSVLQQAGHELYAHCCRSNSAPEAAAHEALDEKGQQDDLCCSTGGNCKLQARCQRAARGLCSALELFKR